MAITNLKIDDKLFKAKLADLKLVKHQAMPQLEKFFIQQTPIDTGNARANTTLNGDVIDANYPYASVLDAGRGYRDGQMRGSEQAPHGMSEPTIEYAKKIVPDIIRKLGRRS
jgi:hypothetical protein